jgi:hypothetical protein
MVGKKLSILVSIFFVIAGAAGAQQIEWTMQPHSQEIYKLEREITERTDEGYVPFGIGNLNGKLISFFLRGPGIIGELWQLKWYHTSEEIEAGVNEEIGKGFVPFGISSTDYGFFIYYIKSGWKTEEWSFIESPANKDGIVRAITRYLKGGFLPVGLTRVGNKYWTLVSSYDKAVVDSVGVETYELDSPELQTSINAVIRQGYLPYGIMVDEENGEEKLFVLYVKFLTE